jgi:hypothetical protein
LINFEVGVMEKTRKNKDTGATEQIGINVWYRCDEVRSTSAISSGRKLHSAEGA